MHLLICDDDARFAARVEQKVRDELAQRGIPAQITVCTRGPEGYTVNAFRYILKRDMERMLPNCLEALFHEKTASGRKVLTIRQNRTEMELPYDSIYCLESDLRKVNVYGDVPHQPLCSYYGKLTDLPAELFENGFLRVGRSDVVNMRYIRQISGYKVTLRNGVELSVSRNGYAAIRATYLEWKGQFSDGS